MMEDPVPADFSIVTPKKPTPDLRHRSETTVKERPPEKPADGSSGKRLPSIKFAAS